MTKTFVKKNRAKRKISLEKNRELVESKRRKNDDDISESDENETNEEWRPIEPMPQSELQGFDSDEDESKIARHLISQHNKKKKRSGGFQSMGISFPVFNAITKKGYKVPTPIQRKTIPIIMDGKDVVAMARTGSGKTAAFLIPMFERLKTHVPTGVRALIMSPTRELALQTLKFTKELGKFTKLKYAVILGGDRMEDQFASMHENPDILIATPGRFMHVIVEMNMKLSNVEYVVFDEADRLFEMGFQEHLVETMKRLPETRQTLLFSATLPRLLVDFAKAGLNDPTLIRLDVDTKLSDNLQISFLQVRNEDKIALLLHLLETIITKKQQTVLFVATKHHVEYLRMILELNNISCSYTYSSLDQTARKINVAKFRQNSTSVLIVTDLAARGIDIPMLDNVINFNFPAKPKLFQHRVGRVARAGRIGAAISLVAPEEIPYVIDLHLFLGKPAKFSMLNKTYPKDGNGYCGRVPRHLIDGQDEKIRQWHTSDDLISQKKVAKNAYKNYVRSRPIASSESIKRTKELIELELGYHPMFSDMSTLEGEEERLNLLDSMKLYRPHTTIFEINATSKTKAFDMMKSKRQRDAFAIERTSVKKSLVRNNNDYDCSKSESRVVDSDCSEDEITNTFTTIVAPKSALSKSYQEKQADRNSDNKVYINYKPKDFDSERGLSLGNNFDKDINGASLDLVNDDGSKKLQNQMKWDRKKKKYVNESGKDQTKKRILTESGTWIKASYKSNLYKEWLDKNKVVEFDDPDEKPMSAVDYRRGRGGRGRGGGRAGGRGGLNRSQSGQSREENNDDRGESRSRGGFRGSRGGSRGSSRGDSGGNRSSSRDRGGSRGSSRGVSRGSSRGGSRGSSRGDRGGKVRSELRSKDEILKTRKSKTKVQNFQKHQKEKRMKRNAIIGKRRK